MEKFFNTGAPNKMEMHYTLDPLHRWDLEEVLTLIRQNKYFVLHAPRQTGKTSSLLCLRDHLNLTGDYAALYVNIEPAEAAVEDIFAGIRVVMGALASNLKSDLKDGLLYDKWNNILQNFGAEQAFNELLKFWAENLPSPSY